MEADAGERTARKLSKTRQMAKSHLGRVSTVGNGKHRKTQEDNKGVCGGRVVHRSMGQDTMGHLYNSYTIRVCVCMGGTWAHVGVEGGV